MKRIIAGIAAALMVFLPVASVGAQERASVEAGFKFWLNDWERSSPSESMTSDTVMLLGPAIRVEFPNHIFLEGTYLGSASDYKFQPDIKFDRQDLEAAAGYMITNDFGLFAGYKNSWFEEKETGDEETVYGPMIGILWNFPANEVFSFFGNLNYLFTKFKLEDALGTVTEDSPGWLTVIGVKYAFTREFSGTLGYKYETSEGKNSDVEDTFAGVIIGAFYTF
jgi:hypothetical protein